MRETIASILCCMSLLASLPSLAKETESGWANASKTRDLNATTSPSCKVNDGLPELEFKIKLAEHKKLELEAKEIEQRINTNWWSGATLPQYVVATAITSALLFGWVKGYIEPIVRREKELNALNEEGMAARNDLLKIDNEKLVYARTQLEAEKSTLIGEQQQLRDQRTRLILERDLLNKKQDTLKNVVSGLNMAVLESAKKGSHFFSILNSGDPINVLRENYGWKVWSDNYFGALGYYIVMTHPDVMAGQQIYVARAIEVDAAKRESMENWKASFEKITARAPLIVLDFSYFALYTSPEAFVGGELCISSEQVLEFYAPLSEWSSQLGALLRNRTGAV